jgi:hypothetical protein
MIPIHELLNRIRWDPEFAKGNFELGYYDRAENGIIVVPLKEVTFPPGSPPPPSNWWIRRARCTVCRTIACVRSIRIRNAFGAGLIPTLLKLNSRFMAVSQSYRDFVLEQLGRVSPVTGKSMFGGVGLYADGLFFALIAEDRLYFKVDDPNNAPEVLLLRETIRSWRFRNSASPLPGGIRRSVWAGP